MSARSVSRLLPRALLLLAGACAVPAALAQEVLIRNATVHTAGTRGSLDHTDVLIQGGIIRAVGTGLAAPAGASVVEA